MILMLSPRVCHHQTFVNHLTFYGTTTRSFIQSRHIGLALDTHRQIRSTCIGHLLIWILCTLVLQSEYCCYIRIYASRRETSTANNNNSSQQP